MCQLFDGIHKLLSLLPVFHFYRQYQTGRFFLKFIHIFIRTILVKQANTQTARLHQRASALVKAGTQSEMIAALQPYLTEEEAGVYRRGHNAKPYNTAKNASRREYLEATGFEALIGYLYLKEDYQRMIDLIRLGLKESGHGL